MKQGLLLLIIILSGFLLFSNVCSYLLYDNFVEMEDCVITEFGKIIVGNGLYIYKCDYMKSGNKYEYEHQCYKNNILNCNIDYKQPDMVGKTVKIGLNSWIVPTIQCVLGVLISIVTSGLLYLNDRKTIPNVNLNYNQLDI